VHYRGSVPWPWYEGMRLARLPGSAARGLLSAFAAGLDILLSDPGLRSGMAAASLQIIGGHERHRWLAEWESLYGLLAATGADERPR
jgi:hypothetical protein